MSQLFPHQLPAYEALRATAEVFFNGDWRGLSIVPRFTRLLIGPSGSGKTHLVRHLARSMQLPIYEISSTSWLPIGSSERIAEPTWKQIVNFCQRNPRGILFIDEIDKLGEQSSWMNHLRVEIFSALDKTIPIALSSFNRDEDDSDESLEDLIDPAQKVLANDVLIVGGGAFQDLWAEKNPKSIGFGEGQAVLATAPEQHELATVIPTEIANRFVTPPLVLLPMNEPEYRALLRRMCSSLPQRLAKRVLCRGEASIAEAIRHGLGCRWAERLLLEALSEGMEDGQLKLRLSGLDH